MTINELLNITGHRPWKLPAGNWSYYQEWNNAIFLHWEIEYNVLRELIPDALEIDLYDGKPWISLVAFTMERIRPKNLPDFKPISTFHEINIRTYVKHKGKPGVYFLSIEGGTAISCRIARWLSGLPYRYSRIRRGKSNYRSANSRYSDKFEIEYSVRQKIKTKSLLDKWLMERYALFQDRANSIIEYDIHHVEWPSFEIKLKHLEISYPRFTQLLTDTPDKMHYSTGVQVIAWEHIIDLL